MTEQAEQWICIKFCIKLECSSAETIWMTQKAAATGNWWLAISSWQCTRSCSLCHTECFGQTSNHPGDSAPSQPRFGTLWLLAFPKTKITFEKKEISDCWWDLGKYNGAADVNWKNCVRSKVPTLKGTEASLSCIQCFLYLVSSSLDVSYYMAGYLLDKPRISCNNSHEMKKA